VKSLTFDPTTRQENQRCCTWELISTAAKAARDKGIEWLTETKTDDDPQSVICVSFSGQDWAARRGMEVVKVGNLWQRPASDAR
jgi:hypothetical protein